MATREIIDEYRPKPARTGFVPPTQPSPTSFQEAVAELERLKLDVSGIDAQLGDLNRTNEEGRRLSQVEWNEWRRKALAARRFKEERKSFLRAWMASQPESARTQRMKVDFLGIPTVVIARRLAKRVGQLESVFHAARMFCESPSPDAHRELSERVSRAVLFLEENDDETD